MNTHEMLDVAQRYHRLNSEEVETILTPDFVGRHPNGRTWDRESHRQFTAAWQLEDEIHTQIAQDEWVATRFTRSGTYQGRTGRVEMMQLKRFVDGRIAEVWEYFDSRQLDGSP